MKFRTHALAVALAALIGLPVFAADKADKLEKKEQKKALNGAAAAIFTLPDTITLTDEQNAKLEEIKKESTPKLQEAQAKVAGVFTKEQRQSRKKATEDAKAAGKKGKELRADVEAAVSLTDEQKKQREEAETGFKKLQDSTREQVTALLTDEQKTKLQETKKKKKKDKSAA